MKKVFKKSFIILSALILCISLAFVTVEYYEISRPGLIVLLYHRVTSDNITNSKYDVSVNNFRQQMNILKEIGYTTILPGDLIDQGANRIPENSIILSFDDGSEDHYNTVYPILKQNGYDAVFFVVTKYINLKGTLNESQIKEMSLNGMEIGSHSHSHPLLENLSDSDIYFELNKSKQEIEKIISTAVNSFAPPGGWFNESVVKTSKAVGYKAFFSCEIGTNELDRKPYLYNRIEVLGTISNNEFRDLLQPSPYLLGYKIVQSVKFLVHDAIGIENYKNFGDIIKKINLYFS